MEYQTSRSLIFALPVLAVGQVVAGSLHDLTGLGQSIPARSAASQTAAVPADYAFVIWAPIFLGCLAFAIHQARPSQRNNELLARLRAPAAAAFTLNIAWEVNAQLNGLAWPSFAIIVALLAASLWAARPSADYWNKVPERDRWLTSIPLHLLAGWVSVATFAHLSSTIRLTGGLGLGMPADSRDILLVLGAAGVAALVVGQVRERTAYAAAVAWGLAGVIAANVTRAPNEGVAAAAGAGLLLLGATMILSRQRRRMSARSVAAALN